MPWARLRNNSLKTRVTVLTLSLFVSSIAVLAFVSSWSLKDSLRRQIGGQQYLTGSMLAQEGNHELDEIGRAHV